MSCRTVIEKRPLNRRAQNYRPAVLAAQNAAGVPASGSAIPEVYDWEHVRESMVLKLPHPKLGDLDVPGSPVRLADYVRAGDGR